MSTKLTTKAVANSVKSDTHVIVAQEENGITSLRRMSPDVLFGAYGANGLRYSNNVLHLTRNGEDVGNGVIITGGSGGGGGDSGAKLTVRNTSGWLAKTVAADSSCPISIAWSSIEDELETGAGIAKITVNGVQKAVLNVQQGEITINLQPYMVLGSNTVRVTISDVYEQSSTVTYTVSVIAISLSSSFDASVAYQGAITFPYTPVGNIAKSVHFLLDGSEIGIVETSISNRQLTYPIAAQDHGAHTFEVYFDCEIDGDTVESNHLYYEIICLEEGETAPIIVSPFNTQSVPQYTTINVAYSVYDPAGLTAPVTISVNGAQAASLTVDRTQQVFAYRADVIGALTIVIASGTASRTISLTVTESDIDIDAETDQLTLYLSSAGRNNNEEHPNTWTFGNISAAFSNFNFAGDSDGWVQDSDGVTVLRVSGDARVTIPYKPFAQDFRSTGKTIEIEFATHSVMNYDATILSCMSGGRGFSLTAQLARMASEQSAVSMQFKEDEHVRISFVVEKRSEHRLMYIYVNGIMSGVVQYPQNDDFSQASPVNISIGSNDCTVDVYCIRIYDNDLTRQQIVNNWIADTQNVQDMLMRYQRNNIYDEYGNIVIAQLPNDLPYMIITCDELPQYKGDKKTVSISYVDPVLTANSFTAAGAQADVQGTSSQYYARKNYKIKFKGGFTMSNGTQVENYAMRVGAIPTDTFTFKADVASSESANNVELARLYNDACPWLTPPQRTDSRVRQGIDGFPIVIFWNDGNETTFLGKYNFNNDKGTEEVFGFSGNDESWEILNNTSNRVLFKDADFDEGWDNDFEARYPDTDPPYTNNTRLQELVAWVASTDQSAVSSASAKRTRLNKFKNELTQYMEKDAVVFYYLFTELFLMVDSRAKNAFPTIMGSGKWFSLPYDFDTAIGINNEGALVFSYNLEDIDQVGGADVFNGQQSVLWINLRQAFYDDIKAMYQSLRSTGKLSYAKVEQMFEEHQSKWPESIFNEDSWFKYLAPLVEGGDGAYLSMLQGSKAEQRKWWLYNRFRYIDSKYNAGDSLSDVITLRGYAKSDVTITPYADVYASIKYGSYLVQTRAARNQAYTLECPLDNVNDTEIYIYSASQLASVGDLSGLKVGYANFSMATKIQNIKLGDSDAGYSNSNMTELYLGNNVLLRSLDVRNCVSLGTGDQKTIVLSGCSNIEHVYFDGTSIAGVDLPNGGILKTLHLPSTITSLILRNQRQITDLTVPSFSNVSTLWLDNVASTVDVMDILSDMAAGSRVRLIGIALEMANATEIDAFFDFLDTMRGLNEAGDTMPTAQVSGTIHTDSLSSAEYAALNARYPYVSVTADHITAQLKFYNYDGSSLLKTVSCIDGVMQGTAPNGPARTSTAQYSYAFCGWSQSKNATSAQADATTGVLADRNVYAAYTATVRTYTVTWKNSNGVTLETDTNVPYGTTPTYNGSTPQNPSSGGNVFTGWVPAVATVTGDVTYTASYVPVYTVYFYNGTTLLQTVQNVPQGTSATYTGATPVHPEIPTLEFLGWSPAPTNIQANTSCYAQFASPVNIVEITDTWDQILSYVSAGTAASRYQIGNYKPLDLGTEGIVNMQIVGINTDELASGNGTAQLTWISKELLNTSRRMNPTVQAIYEYPDVPSWKLTSIGYESQNRSVISDAVATWTITATTAGTVTITYRTSTSSKVYNTLDLTVNGNVVASGFADGSAQTHTVTCAQGDTVTVSATYHQRQAYNNYGRIQFTSTGTISTEATIQDAPTQQFDHYVTGTGAVGGFDDTEMYTYLDTTVMGMLPSNVAGAVKAVKKYSRNIDTAGSTVNNVVSTPKLWLPSMRELNINGNETEGPQYKYIFPDNTSRIKYKVGAASASSWWSRSAYNSSPFIYVHTSGTNYSDNAQTNYGVALGFCT